MIVWLASYPKSGNTWLRKFLHAYVQGPPFRLNQFHPLFRSDLPTREFQAVSQTPITELTFGDHLMLRNAVLWNMMQRAGDVRLYLKTHFGLSSKCKIEFIPHHITAGAVYIMRDPRDLVLSYAHHYGIDVDKAIDDISDPAHTIYEPGYPLLMHGIGGWSNHVRSWGERDYPVHRLLVRYEHMVRKPHSTFRQILGFLNEPWDQERFNFALRSTRFKALKAEESAKGFAEKSPQNDHFFRSGRVGEWKDILTTKQVARITAAHGETMEKYGYG